MAKSQSLASLSVDALIKLRDDIGSMLSDKVGDLKRQLASLTGTSVGNGRKRGRPPGSLKGRKVAAKYRGPNGVTWAGRGATPLWMVEAIKGGAKKEEFLIAKSHGKAAKNTKRKAA
jgi:DNA-binding protein H-NS